jgi:hypothetical protein
MTKSSGSLTCPRIPSRESRKKGYPVVASTISRITSRRS